MTKTLSTRNGIIHFPSYIPVTTFGDRYPLDNMIRPYLPRLADAVMVSYYYAQFMKPEDRPPLPLCVDSGGFAALFEGNKIRKRNGLGIIEINRENIKETITPNKILKLQEQIADIAFTLDFPIPPGTTPIESKRRQELTINNALWALENKKRHDLYLYACIQAWDAKSARKCARIYTKEKFDGIAIGGLIPRLRDIGLVIDIVRSVKRTITNKPLHVFGVGKPEIVKKLFDLGVDSVDSSNYVQYGATGKFLNDTHPPINTPSIIEQTHLSIANICENTGKQLPKHLEYINQNINN